MKRFLALLLCLTLTLGLLTCCGEPELSGSDSAMAGGPTQTDAPTFSEGSIDSDVSSDTDTDLPTTSSTEAPTTGTAGVDTEKSSDTPASEEEDEEDEDLADGPSGPESGSSSEDAPPAVLPEIDHTFDVLNDLVYDPTLPHLVMASGLGPSGSARVVIYDLNRCSDSAFGDLSSCIVWESNGYSGDVSGVKFRYSFYDRTDVVVITLSSGIVEVIDYNTKKTLRRMTGIYNAHSVEMLPDGSIVVAASGHSEINYADGGLHYFPAGKTEEASFFTLPFAHAVLWDPDGEHFWALGFSGIVAAKIEQGKIVKIPGKGCSNYLTGHDMVPATGLPGKYWVTDNTDLYLFDSATGALKRKGDPHTMAEIKGVAYFPDGTMVMTAGKLCGGDAFAAYASKGVRIVFAEAPGQFRAVTVPLGRYFYKVHTLRKDYR